MRPTSDDGLSRDSETDSIPTHYALSTRDLRPARRSAVLELLDTESGCLGIVNGCQGPSRLQRQACGPCLPSRLIPHLTEPSLSLLPTEENITIFFLVKGENKRTARSGVGGGRYDTPSRAPLSGHGGLPQNGRLIRRARAMAGCSN